MDDAGGDEVGGTPALGSRAPPRVVLAGRIVMLLAAAGAAVAGFAITGSDDRGAGSGKGARPAAAAYVCPMHPEVTAAAAGECPICRMALERVPSRAATAGDATAAAAPAPAAFRPSYDIMWARRRPVSRAMLAPAWIDDGGAGTAVLYDDELALLDPAGEEGTFVTAEPRAPGVPVRAAGDPPVRWDGATSTVRFRAAGGAALPAGAVGWLRLAPRTRETLVVPASAVLTSADGPYVLGAAADRRTFTRRPVRVGRASFGYAAVVAGVRDGERVAVMDTFFLDAERRLAVAPAGQGPP